MEFLCLLMCNVPSMRCIGLTESRETKLLGMIAEWMGRRPAAGRAPLLVTPVEMARLLGHLVFASQVVQGGRVAMQAMLSSFKGMVVDWRLGGRLALVDQVRPTASVAKPEGRGRLLASSGGSRTSWREAACRWRSRRSAWRWWREPTRATRSGYGNLIWLDGHRCEEQLRFSAVERSKPINWR